MFPEKDAHKRWCPFARASEDGAHSYNRVYRSGGTNESSLAKCIGSSCAAWRWIGEKNGYCGLAGKP
jgi:hypothetical protein